MSISKQVELHFIDGPLQGTRKMEDSSIIQRNRTYRHLQPTPYKPEIDVPNNTAQDWKQVVCIEWHYLPFRLPSSYGTERYAMVVESEGLGK